jgi:3-methylfumaryl-CoA hydratase
VSERREPGIPASSERGLSSPQVEQSAQPPRAEDRSEPELADTGFTRRASTTVAHEHAALLAATLDVAPELLDSGELPIPWHWACFVPNVPTAELGPDGHPRRRPDMAAYPQRMWVGGRVRVSHPLRIGDVAERTSHLATTELKEGSTGRFWLVTVAHTITQDGQVGVVEEQDLVLRAPSGAAAPGPDAREPPDADWVEERTADPALLFRYSALTFNTHRIHYDEPYATHVEGYPGLVVQGPLTATLLADLARRRVSAPVRALAFRARVPLFANERFWLTGDPTEAGADLAAIRGDGRAAMTLTATF